MIDLVARGDILDALIEKGQKSKRYKLGENWELNLSEIKEAVESVPSAEPEHKNQKTALSVQVKADFDDMKDLLEDIGNLQTYKFFEGNDMVLVNIEDIKGILTKHVKAKEVQPERNKGEWIKEDLSGYLTPGGNSIYHCSECGHTEGPWPHPRLTNFCPSCGTDMRGEKCQPKTVDAFENCQSKGKTNEDAG